MFILPFCFSLQYFPGNRDQNTIVSHPFIPALRCRYVRVRPWGWYRHISMRLEFYGCLTGTNLGELTSSHSSFLGKLINPKPLNVSIAIPLINYFYHSLVEFLFSKIISIFIL